MKQNFAGSMSQPHRIPIRATAGDSHGSESGDENESVRSLSSASAFYRYENGRRYHTVRDGEYWAPNDQLNSQHEKIFHHLMLLTLNDKSYPAPITNPKQAIDLGTGTGIWAIDFAEKSEEAEVLGIALSIVSGTL